MISEFNKELLDSAKTEAMSREDFVEFLIENHEDFVRFAVLEQVKNSPELSQNFPELINTPER